MNAAAAAATTAACVCVVACSRWRQWRHTATGARNVLVAYDYKQQTTDTETAQDEPKTASRFLKFTAPVCDDVERRVSKCLVVIRSKTGILNVATCIQHSLLKFRETLLH